jgi:putative hydrolase of the HAD superfamily
MNIFFDLDGTLLHFTEEYDTVIENTLENVHGYSSQKLVQSYSESFFRNFENFSENPYKKAFENLDIESNAEQLVSTLQQKELEICQLPNDGREVLNELQERHTLGVLTNGVSKWQRNKLEHFDLSPYFDSVVVSYDVGHHKPDEQIFRLAEKTVKGSEFLMVGDSPEDDIQGAENVGWKTEIYENSGFSSLDIY